MQADASKHELYKAEWRRTERMRAKEERLLPSVLQSSFPPEAGPHGIASNPPPTYATPPHSRAAQRPPRPAGTAFGALDLPVPAAAKKHHRAGAATTSGGVAAYYPGRRFDWSETALNDPRADYAMLRPDRSPTGSRARFGTQRELSREGMHHKTLASVVLSEESRPATCALDVPRRRARSVGAAPGTRAVQPPRHAAASQQASAPHGTDQQVQRTNCASDKNPYLPRAQSVGLPAGRRHDAADWRSQAASATAGLMWHDAQADRDRAQLVHDCRSYLHKASNSLRTYDMSNAARRPPTAISTIATTFARAPRAPHVLDVTLASPSERIAANYSLRAWGLSARTLQFIDRATLRSEDTESAMQALQGGMETQSMSPAIAQMAPADVQQHAHKQMAGLPLELFDDTDYETRTPQEWVALGADSGGTRAMSAWFNMTLGQTEQRPVRVVSYDATSCTYEVRFEKGGVGKRVKRLNLCFEAEDDRAFARRIAGARAARAEHEAALRQRFLLDANDAEDVVDTYDFEAKTLAVAQACPGISDKVFQALRFELVEEFLAEYRLAVRAAQLAYHRCNPSIEAKMQPLQLPAAAQKVPAPASGVLAVVGAGESRYAALDVVQDVLYGRMFAASPELQQRIKARSVLQWTAAWCCSPICICVRRMNFFIVQCGTVHRDAAHLHTGQQSRMPARRRSDTAEPVVDAG